MRISDWSSAVCPSDLLAAGKLVDQAQDRGDPFVLVQPRVPRLLAQFDRAQEALGPVAAGVERVRMRRIGILGQPQQRHQPVGQGIVLRSEEHTSELQSLMRISYAVFCLKKKKNATHK